MLSVVVFVAALAGGVMSGRMMGGGMVQGGMMPGMMGMMAARRTLG